MRYDLISCLAFVMAWITDYSYRAMLDEHILRDYVNPAPYYVTALDYLFYIFIIIGIAFLVKAIRDRMVEEEATIPFRDRKTSYKNRR